MPITPSSRTRLEKAAVDNGFDLELAQEGDWLGFASSHAPLRVWLTALGDGFFLAAMSQLNVLRAIAEHGTSFSSPLPAGACGARGVKDFGSLHRLLHRAFLLSRTLPDELLKAFERETAGLPRSTEIERLVIQRLGQDKFRDGLLGLWEGRCAMSGLAVVQLLRASHIKPWASCDRDQERLDVYNGFLLSANLDAAFDGGLITVADDGLVLVSNALNSEARVLLGLDQPVKVRRIDEKHMRYLAWHRGHLFKT
jgi:putative restriction endonuclease